MAAQTQTLQRTSVQPSRVYDYLYGKVFVLITVMVWSAFGQSAHLAGVPKTWPQDRTDDRTPW